jgi:uncharacterized protein (TIGR02001 family)
MKRTALSLAMIGAFASVPSISVAQTVQEPAANALTANITLTSDYRFRGISQTKKGFAVQGGIDWTGPGGLYLGNWNSTVSDDQYLNGRGIEMDLYGGYKVEIAKDLTLDVGAIYYYYPGAYYSGSGISGKPRYSNFEVYAGLTSGPFSAKAYYALSNLFGLNSTTASVPNGDSKGSYYLDLGYSAEIMPKLTLGAHVGYQSVKNYGDFSYVDYKVGLTYDLAGWMLGANVYTTNADKNLYQVQGKKLGETGLVLSVSRTF